MSKTDEALKIFSGNFNCAQATFVPFAETFGLDRETALKMTTMLGGGMRCGEVCGAVAGGLLAMGLVFGHSIEDDIDTKAKAYALGVEFNKRFKEKNKSVICKQLLGYNMTDPNEKAQAMAVHDGVCPGFVQCAVQIAEALIAENS